MYGTATSFFALGQGEDSNLRHRGYEPRKLPLLYPAKYPQVSFTQGADDFCASRSSYGFLSGPPCLSRRQAAADGRMYIHAKDFQSFEGGGRVARPSRGVEVIRVSPRLLGSLIMAPVGTPFYRKAGIGPAYGSTNRCCH